MTTFRMRVFAAGIVLVAGLTAAGGDPPADPAKGGGAAARPVAGVYVLSAWDDMGEAEVTRMTLTPRAGGGFSARGVDQAWSGEGRLDGAAGSYHWVFATGERGTTTLTVLPDGTLKGEVRPDGGRQGVAAPWTFRGRREGGDRR